MDTSFPNYDYGIDIHSHVRNLRTIILIYMLHNILDSGIEIQAQSEYQVEG